ncbi:hypothetical protein [Sphingomonas sp. Leaf205]|uniref:hypothetical protein n=1 Tax=Sphingomonas sp. Leaf205 TaxID=2876551 RepID=UPI001E3DEA23|nr:hypothetical protein [Sphingomonas sp. Leaf205]
MIRTMAIPTMMLLAACGSATVASEDAQAMTAAATTKPLDIAGIRPGMKTADALALVKQGGWAVRANPGDSWAETVEQAVAQRLQKLPPSSKRTGVYSYSASKGEETLSFNIDPTPDGGRVGLVQYRAPQAGRTYAQIRTEVIGRYGPSIYGPRQGVLIAPRGKDGETLSLEVDSTGMHLTLMPAAAAASEARAVIDRAVTAKVGSVGKSF